MTWHANASSIHKGAYIQSSDPGAVGAKVLWFDTTSGFVLKKRNDANSGWDTIGVIAPVTTDLSQNVSLSGDISPAQITANQNDYNPTGLSTASTLRLTSDASRNITGLQGGADGRLLIIYNVGAQNIIFKDEDANSTAGNRFAFSADVTLAADQAVFLQYDSTSSRWRLIAGPVAAGAPSIAPLTIDSANVVSQRNSTNAQTFKVYKTDDGAGNANWIQLNHTGSNQEILSTGTGTGGISNIVFRVAGGGDGIVLSTSALIPTTDRGMSVGSGTNRFDTGTFFDVVANGGSYKLQSNWQLLGYGDGLMQFVAAGGSGGTIRFTFGDSGTGTCIQRPSGQDYFEIKDGAGTNFKGLRAKYFRSEPVTVANLPASPVEGMLVAVTDSNTATWGATISGGGANKVLAYYNGTNWTVAAV